VKITGPHRMYPSAVISELRDRLSLGVGRHLYGVLGTYRQLGQFEQVHLGQATRPQGGPFPEAINLNRELLAGIGDDDLRRLVRDEARRQQAVRYRLKLELDRLIGERLQGKHLLILKQLELVFAYNLDLGVFRTRATNQDHVLLLLPGERRGEHTILFHEAGPELHRSLPNNLVADNHLWELTDG